MFRHAGFVPAAPPGPYLPAVDDLTDLTIEPTEYEQRTGDRRSYVRERG